MTESNGRQFETRYSYDDSGRLQTVTPPGIGNVSTYSYAPDGSWIKVSRGSYFKDTYVDGLGRVTSTINSEGVQSSISYNAMSQAWFKSYLRDGSTGEVGEKFVYDGLGRVVEVTKGYRPATNSCDAVGACKTTFAYLSNCVSTSVERVVNESATTWRCFTSYGRPDEQRLAQVFDAKGSLWQYPYNAFGRTKGVTAPLSYGNRTYSYDERQFLKTETHGETGLVEYGRNAIGQMTARKDARGVTATFGYNDLLSRLRSITYQGGVPAGAADDVTQDFDNANNLWHLASANGGNFGYTYDEVDRITSQTWTYGGRDYVTTYHYDAAGCLYSMTYPSGLTLTMTCDSLNRVTSISIGGAIIVRDVAYHPSGQVKSMTTGDNRVSALVYDARARLQSIASSGVANLTYTYDGANNVRSVCRDAGDTSCANFSTAPNFTRTIEYDLLDRVQLAIDPNQWGTAAYDYDELGNITLKSVGSYTTNYYYDGNDRLASLSGGPPLNAPVTFTWDQANRLASSSDGSTYRYDGRGRRVVRSDATQTILYHYDAQGRVVAETLSNGTKLRDYIYLSNKLLAVDGCVGATPPNCSERQYYHTDALGSVVARTDVSGNVVARLDYQPWGEQSNPSGIQGDRQYNGRVYDAGTTFHDYGARMYWPQTRVSPFSAR